MKKIVKASTAYGMTLLRRAAYCEGRDLYTVYGRPSDDKKKAFRNCLRVCSLEGGRNFRLISHNTFTFSVAWETPHGTTRVITRDNSYEIYR